MIGTIAIGITIEETIIMIKIEIEIALVIEETIGVMIEEMIGIITKDATENKEILEFENLM